MRRLICIAVVALAAVSSCKRKPASARVATPDAGAAAKGADERWGGRIEVPGSPLEFEVRFETGTPAKAGIAIPAQGLPPTVLHDVVHDADKLAFTLVMPNTPPSANAVFTVTREAGGRSAKGQLDQHGQRFPVIMRQLAAGETFGGGAERPQTPKPPFPYASRDVTYQGKDGVTLAGTLTVPAGAGKHPAVLLITGTGPQDRDSTLSGHKLFLVLADHLTRAGIAVLRVDDRGVGGSGGDTAATDYEGKITDVLAGTAWLAAQADIDPARIGLIGHSEGGLLAPAVAARSPEIAFIVLLAGPGVTGAELIRSQTERMLRAKGGSPKLVAENLEWQNKFIAAAEKNLDTAGVRALVEQHVDATLAKLPAETRAKINAAMRQRKIEEEMLQVAAPAARAFILSNPALALAKVRCPVLALNGTLDLQVPHEANLAGIRAALAKGNNPDVTVEALPGLNHLMQPAKIGTTEEWPTLTVTIDPPVLDKVTTWLRARAKL